MIQQNFIRAVMLITFGMWQKQVSFCVWIIVDVKDAAHSEELVLNTVSTLNNLSFYNDVDSVVQQRQVEITESKCNIK